MRFRAGHVAEGRASNHAELALEIVAIRKTSGEMYGIPRLRFAVGRARLCCWAAGPRMLSIMLSTLLSIEIVTRESH